jgi:beta-lactamase superfamily II metal-dependent hydrolase
MILLRWDENGSSRAALIDAYSPTGKVGSLVKWLRGIGVGGFTFVAVTHPHLDHLFNLDGILSAFVGNVEYAWFWPGLNQAAYVMYFNKLARRFPNSPNMLGTRAAAVSAFFNECDRQFYGLQLGRPVLLPVRALSRIYPVAGASNGMDVLCISPWEDPSMRFISLVGSGIRAGGVVTDTHRESNLVSAGFVVTYGASQVVLGGDMEEANWRPLLQSCDCPIFSPCVVKVSHHGSSNGRVSGMWGAAGFLGKDRPIVVVTPWNQKLPEAKVLDEIKSSGCDTYLTGQQRHRVEEGLSRIHIRVHEDGRRPDVVFLAPSVKRIQ